MANSTSSAREEAERLVATVLAMAKQSGLGGVGRGRDKGAPSTSALDALGDTVAGVVGQLTGASGGHRSAGGSAKEGWATGSAECCVCPICKAIAAMRDPSPQTAARLATGAGDFATGVASLMRAFSAISGDRSRTSRPARPAPPPPDPDTAWSAATRGPGDHESRPEPAGDQNASPWSAATRAPAPEGQAEEPAAASGPRTKEGLGSSSTASRTGNRDVWAAATHPEVPGVAVPPAVDHDDAGDGENR
jgi:hypothetical protein